GFALSDFDGSSYGPEFLSMKAGEEITRLSKEDDGGWSFGLRHSDSVRGWFPTEYVSVAAVASQKAPARQVIQETELDPEEDRGQDVFLALLAEEPAPDSQKSKLEERHVATLCKVLQAAGGRALLGNLSAAVLALGIMHGPHQHVYKDVIAL
ncbi:unnamed protein product, partial [Polarella glacialis]